LYAFLEAQRLVAGAVLVTHIKGVK
jgi:hypothetical protein